MSRLVGMDTIHGRIRTARERVGLSQEAVARELELSSKTIIRIEKGEYEPSIALVRRLAAVIGETEAFLLTGLRDRSKRRGSPGATTARGHADPLDHVRKGA